MYISKLLNEAYGKAATAETAGNAFRASGIWYILQPKPSTECGPISMSSNDSDGDDTVADICQTRTIEHMY